MSLYWATCVTRIENHLVDFPLTIRIVYNFANVYKSNLFFINIE